MAETAADTQRGSRGDPHFSTCLTVVLVPVCFEAVPRDFAPGPLPLPLVTGPFRIADAEARRTYFDQRAADVLYGDAAGSGRWHRVEVRQPGPVDGTLLIDLELWRIRAADAADGMQRPRPNGVLLAHLTVEGDDVIGALAAAVGAKSPDAALRGWTEAVTDGSAYVPADVGRAFNVVMAVPTEQGLAAQPLGDIGWSPHEQWLWLLASATPVGRYRPDPEDASLFAERHRLSGDWHALVLRDGAAFVATRADRGADDYLRSGATYVRTIYTDALLLGLAQQLELTTLANALAHLDDLTGDLHRLLRLEERFSAFRNAFWWQHLTQHGHGNDLLRSLQRQRALPALLDQIVHELSDYSRQAQIRAQQAERAAQRVDEERAKATNMLLSLLAVVGLPVTFVQVVLALVGGPGWVRALLATAVIVVGAAIILSLPLAKELRSWRRTRPSRRRLR